MSMRKFILILLAVLLPLMAVAQPAKAMLMDHSMTHEHHLAMDMDHCDKHGSSSQHQLSDCHDCCIAPLASTLPSVAPSQVTVAADLHVLPPDFGRPIAYSATDPPPPRT